MNKSKHSKVESVSVPSTPVSPGTTPIPTNVSAPPEGWVVPEKLGKKGRRPKTGLILATPNLVNELRENAEALIEELGSKAVDPKQLASALERAHGWKKAEEKAASFHLFVRSERGTSWDAALTLMLGMKAGVQFALARDATFADRFPGVAKTFASTRRPRTKSTNGATDPAATPATQAQADTSATTATTASGEAAPETATKA